MKQCLPTVFSSKDTTLLKLPIEGVMATAITGGPGNRRESGDENVVIEIMGENVPNLGKNMGKCNKHFFSKIF